jgi:hypothetical protein
MADFVPIAVDAGGGHPGRVDEFVGLPEFFRETLGAGSLIGPFGEEGFEVFDGGSGGEGGFHPFFQVV